MPTLSRRTFLASSALAAAPFPQVLSQGLTQRNLLGNAWPAERLAHLLPREQFQPFPTGADRPAWEALPADARAALLASGEEQLRHPWEVLPATLFLEYKRNGNRSRYEAVRNRRREKLQHLVVAECLEGKGRFTDEIANGIWLTCEETFWGVPAHLGVQKAGTGLGDVTDPIVDLFAAETASLLAWTDYLLGPLLRAISPLIPERIRLETDRRILGPALTRDFAWMGFNGHSVNNWDPWICSNWLTATLLLEPDSQRRVASVQKIVHCLDHFLNAYHDDGGCDEGPGYWSRAGASLFDCLELLRLASGGALDGFRFPLVREIGLYICRAHIYNEWYTNFADAPARVYPDGDLIHRYGQRVNDETMTAHGAFAAFYRDPNGIPGDSLGRQLPALFHLAELRQAPRNQALLRDTWLPGIQVMAARLEEGSARGLYLAAQGGHNAESHNHNDVGNFMVYAGGRPAIIDVGVETYTAKTFGPHRYEIWTMQSAFHNCPTIDGVMQAAGRQYEATEVSCKPGELRLNIAKAYPKEANLESWYRKLSLNRETNEIEVQDDYRLSKAAKEITLTLMTPWKVAEDAPGTLNLEDVCKVQYDSTVFTVRTEEIALDDARLQSVWKKRICRILLVAKAPPTKGTWKMRIFT